MSSLAISALAFACIFCTSLIAMFIKRRLPDHHLSSESKDVVKLGMGLIASLAALVLGLLIATSKGTYDAQAGAINEFAANCLFLDRIMERYGPEMQEPRALLKRSAEGTLERIWPTEKNKSADLAPGGASRTNGEALFDKVGEMTPKTEAQRELRSRAIGIMTDMAQARMRLLARQDSTLPTPFLVVLIFWLSILFGGYGLLAAENATVVTVLIVCSLSLAGAIFLMLELSSPFTGIMRVSSYPLEHAITLLGK